MGLERIVFIAGLGVIVVTGINCSSPELIDRPSNHVIGSQTTDAIVFGDRRNHFTQETRTTPGRNEAAYEVEREQISGSMLIQPGEFFGVREFAYALSHLEGTKRDYARARSILKKLYEDLSEAKFDASLRPQVEKFKERVDLYRRSCEMFLQVMQINSSNPQHTRINIEDKLKQPLLLHVGGFVLDNKDNLYVTGNLAELYTTKKAAIAAEEVAAEVAKQNPDWNSRALELLAQKQMDHLQAIYDNIDQINRNQFQWFTGENLPDNVNVYDAMAAYAQALVHYMIKNHGGERFIEALKGADRISSISDKVDSIPDVGCHFVDGKPKDSQFLEELLCKQGELYERLADIYKRKFRFHGNYSEHQYRGLLEQALVWYHVAEKKSRGRDGFNAAHRSYLRVQEKLERAE
ncbi:hypothetical protein KY336_00460 [Candidatus Woesearchaeota archaeon]|nr:hypothetical protein [Candidatus Woesearchaeota archaeon]